ncbi:MAG: hypothetical protein LLG42_13890 [Chloroflexi bacterium]|nr:hypothetical protein [Chloroflexota bacterium]
MKAVKIHIHNFRTFRDDGYRLMIGQVEDQTTLPVGCLAELDVEAGTLRLLEAGVVG